MWLAAFLFAATGTGPRSRAERDQILWHMSLAELMLSRHCALRGQDFWTLLPAPDAAEQVERLAAWQPTDFQA